MGNNVKRCGPIDSAQTHGASLDSCDANTVPRPAGAVHQAQGMSLAVSGSQDTTVPLGEKKSQRPTFLSTQPGPRFRTCCATTTADKNVVKRPRDLILGAEHARTSKARDLSWDCTAALQGGRQQNQHQHQRASSPHSSRGSCLIFLGPQHQILLHRHGHVAGPLPVCPAY